MTRLSPYIYPYISKSAINPCSPIRGPTYCQPIYTFIVW